MITIPIHTNVDWYAKIHEDEIDVIDGEDDNGGTAARVCGRGVEEGSS